MSGVALSARNEKSGPLLNGPLSSQPETACYWTNSEVTGKPLGDDKPVFVLTSSRTFSGGEEFTNNLKSLKRATIVGETTGGGAHPVAGERINDHFKIGVPFAHDQPDYEDRMASVPVPVTTTRRRRTGPPAPGCGAGA